ncbi:MAG: chemotaxis protein CheR [Treponema sp.]|jgi:chemotaxis protein methyltransferase CheR|nr:chemotaxis protein CheR [Treponema sp.]
MTVHADVLANPALLFLYYRIEHLFGIKATNEALFNLNKYLENLCGAAYTEDPAAFELTLSSREQIFQISKLLTVAETYFFREGAHFNLLSELLPQFTKLNRPVQILSAATSIGCEAYSIAMFFDYHKKNGVNIDFKIDAFDINADAIETAKIGRYTANSFRKDGSAFKYIMDSYLIPDGDNVVVSDNIRSKVCFFPYNIMNDLDKVYDIIFFRNALIYFAAQTRLIVLNNLAESLADNGLLFLGISETSSINHPLLESRYLSDIFFFQKFSDTHQYGQSALKLKSLYNANSEERRKTGDRRSSIADKCPNRRTNRPETNLPAITSKSFLYKSPVCCKEIKTILEVDEGQPNAKYINEILVNSDGRLAPSISGSELAACVVYFLSIQNLDSAGLVLSYLEKCNNGYVAMFLRGEYHLLTGNAKEAENYFEQSAGKEKTFWPAFYRMAVLAAEGNAIRYEYKAKTALESLELGKYSSYECFMGGFSPEYFCRILERKLD